MPIAGNVFVLNWTNTAEKAVIDLKAGTEDTTRTSLHLVGQGNSEWGEITQENLLHLLENFSSKDAPVAPTEGQLWWESDTNTLKVYTGNVWEIISKAVLAISDTPPADPSLGYLWYESDTKFLWVWDGATWKIVYTSISLPSATAPLSPVNGQLWLDTTTKKLKAWDSGGGVWYTIGPADIGIPIIGGYDWGLALPLINQIIGTPSGTNDVNAYGYGQTQFAEFLADAPTQATWLHFYDVIIGICDMLAISRSDLIKNDMYVRGSGNGYYGVPTILDQWTKLQAKLTLINTGSNRFNVISAAKELFSDATLDSTYIGGGTWGAGNSLITTEYLVQFTSSNHAKAFFNAGGFIQLVSSLTDSSSQHNIFWKQLLGSVATTKFRYNKTTYKSPSDIDATTIGYYDLSTIYQTVMNATIFDLPASDFTTFYTTGPYIFAGSGNYYRIEARLENSNADIRFRVTLNDSYVGAADVVSQALTTNMSFLKVSEVYLNDFEINYPTGLVTKNYP